MPALPGVTFGCRQSRPRLNPVENIWQFIRENWLSNRIFTSYWDILDHCCCTWSRLIDQPRDHIAPVL
jgi:hypothetical protein